MDANKKARVARVLGYICITVGTLNLILVVAGRTQSGSALLVTGVSALTGGIFMVALGKRKPTP